jgi:hypothetical protein
VNTNEEQIGMVQKESTDRLSPWTVLQNSVELLTMTWIPTYSYKLDDFTNFRIIALSFFCDGWRNKRNGNRKPIKCRMHGLAHKA